MRLWTRSLNRLKTAHERAIDHLAIIIETDLPPLGFWRAAAQLFPDWPRGGRVRVAITAWLITAFVTWVDDWVRPLIPDAVPAGNLPAVEDPGSGLIIALVALTLLGFLTANLVGRTLVQLGDRSDRSHADRAPDLQDGEAGLPDAVLEIGNELPQGRPRRIPGARHVVAGVPVAAAEQGCVRAGCRAATIRFPFFFLYAQPDDRVSFSICRASKIIELDIPVEAAATLIMSAGMIQPGASDAEGQGGFAAIAAAARAAQAASEKDRYERAYQVALPASDL